MKRLARWILPACAVLALALVPSTASASRFRYLRITNPSTGPGVCNITIEPFGLLAGKMPQTSDVQTFVINVNVPTGSSPANTAILIRNAATGVLTTDYTVAIPKDHPDFVQFVRSEGTFDMTVSNSVPGQTIVEDDIALPNLDPRALLLLSMLLLAAALWYLRSGTLRSQR